MTNVLEREAHRETDRDPVGRPTRRLAPANVLLATMLVGSLVVVVLAIGTGSPTVSERPTPRPGNPFPESVGVPEQVQPSSDFQPVITVGGWLPGRPPRGEYDPAIGMRLPGLLGYDRDGLPHLLSGYDQDRAKPLALALVTHWSPTSEALVDTVAALSRSNVANDVDVQIVVTASRPNLPGFPAADWLGQVDAGPDVVLDDQQESIRQVLGLGASPSLVLVGRDNRVRSRWTWPIGADQLVSELAELVRSPPPPAQGPPSIPRSPVP